MGLGKCWGCGTLMLKFDGSVVPVEEIVEGDLVRLHTRSHTHHTRTHKRASDSETMMQRRSWSLIRTFWFVFFCMLFCVCS
jgi:hypothetical protein